MAIGRPKGSPNKASLDAREIFRRENFDPLRKMVQLAKGHEKVMRDIDKRAKDDPEYKSEMLEIYVSSMNALFPLYKELANYAHPKRKAIEITGEDGDPIIVQHLWGAPADIPGRPEDGLDASD